MSDTFVTIDQFNEILARLGRLEHKEQYTGRHEDVYKDVEELKKKFPDVEKDVSVIRTRFDSLEEKIDYRFDIVNERFNTVNEKITSLQTEMHTEFKAVRTELRITLGAILAVLITIGIKLIFYS